MPPDAVGAADPATQLERANILGVGVSALAMAEAVGRIEHWIGAGAREYVCVTGMHGVMESQSDPALRRIHNRAGMVVPDGMPLVWLSRAATGRPVERVAGPDLMPRVLARSAATGHRHFFYGGAAGVPERLADRCAARLPGLRVAGTYSPPFRPLSVREEDEVAARIDAAAPDVVWVGLSTPKQERWMARFRPRLRAPVLIGVGAAFDLHAGLARRAPAWMQRSGLEWAFRLAHDPRRLWRRYVHNIPRFIALVALQQLGLARYALDDDRVAPPHIGVGIAS
jgi:N-acetylglucosaminyldiphosphoundecaprenol N-acetyl-beta-D-mannosaminyltransferase